MTPNPTPADRLEAALDSCVYDVISGNKCLVFPTTALAETVLQSATAHLADLRRENTRTASASIDTIRSMIVGEDARIVAARQRLRDAKAIHTIWSELPTYQAEPYAQANMNNIEHIIYSAICYLDGIDGPYLREALATSVEKG